MRHLTTQTGLICAALMLSASEAWALPNCPSNPNAIWTNCVGTITYASGASYVGEWQNNQRNGQGTETYPNGDVYDGEYKDSKRNGQGTITYANGDIYVGEFKDDKRNGQGTFTFADGPTYVGEWLDNKRHGQGTATYADGTVEEGIWENGEFKYANRAEPPVVSETKPRNMSAFNFSTKMAEERCICECEYLEDFSKMNL